MVNPKFNRSYSMRGLAVYLLFFAAMLATIKIYLPALHGPFVFDDQINIVNNQHLRLHDLSWQALREAAMSMPSGMLNRPVSMLSFALNYYTVRADLSPFPTAYYFKLTNLVIHLLNGVAIFALTNLLVANVRRRLQPRLPASYASWLALVVASAWLLHPLNITGVLYVVQRMTSLESLFVLLGLSFYVAGRDLLDHNPVGGTALVLCGLLVFTPLAVFSKESGLLMPLFVLLIEFFIYRFETAPDKKKLLYGFFIIFVAIPLVAAGLYIASHSDVITAGYLRRDFNLEERLLSEGRVIWFYLRQVLVPSTALMGLYHDDFTVSHGLLAPWSTLAALAGLLLLVSLAWVLRKREPLVALGIAFFLIGHSMESTVIPLELVHEHRNYLPMFGILLAFFHIILHPLIAPGTLKARTLLAGLLVPLFTFGTVSRAEDWTSPAALWQTEVRNHPKSVRANIANGDFYSNAIPLDSPSEAMYFQMAQEAYGQVLSFDRYNTNALFALIRLSSLHERPMDPAWLMDLGYGLEHNVLPLNTNDRLVDMAICIGSDKCPLKRAELLRLIDAALKNDRVPGGDKALIRSAQIFYLFNVEHDYAGALAATRSALQLDAGIEYRQWLATIYVAMHRTADAREQIAIIREMDRNKLKAKDLEALEQQLASGQ